MDKHTPRFLTLLTVIASVALLALSGPAAVTASPLFLDPQGVGLRVSNALIDLRVASGRIYAHTMTVSISPATPATEVRVEACGLGQEIDGSFRALPVEADLSPHSARGLIRRIDNDLFRLEPGESQIVTVTIEIPSHLPAQGSRYAMVHLGGHPLDGSQFNVNVDVPVIITPAGAHFTETGAITDLRSEEGDAGGPQTLFTLFRNTGDHHYKARNQVIVWDEAGQEVLRTITSPGATSLIPSYLHQFAVSLASPGEGAGLTPGRYRLESSIIRADGALISAQQAPLVISAPPIPPDWDVNIDHICDVFDIITVGVHWMANGDPGWVRADISRDGTVNIMDVVAVGSAWGQTW